MLKINDEDWELPQIGKSPKIGYEYEYTTKEVISGKIYRVPIGRRFTASISYAFLSDEQASVLLAMATGGAQHVEITTPFDTFDGNAFIEISSTPTRFKDNNNNETWTDWRVNITGSDLIS